MPHLERDGVRIHYEVHGGGDPVLLSHGFSATAGMWDDQVEALAPHYQVITWDMRGHGRSDYPDDLRSIPSGTRWTTWPPFSGPAGCSAR